MLCELEDAMRLSWNSNLGPPGSVDISATDWAMEPCIKLLQNNLSHMLFQFYFFCHLHIIDR